ncbi:LLM class flavin-dependent oxidoreductase [Streptacidiphilus sp. EB129]|uniref:LLM class flavin-dependent oxidoreductase n=1 Tax=Streptacidiphilus sp. EB129 TaxID=3156262 RepID=UPI0035125F88
MSGTKQADGMDNEMRTGVLLPTGRAQWGAGADPRELIGFARRVEELGFDSIWVNDSLLSPRIEALTMLSALATVTERVTLGTAALMPVLRRPVQAAQALASIDLLSGGRLVVTVGAGFPGRLGQPLHELSEVPWERRFTRLDETVELWRGLWSPQGPGLPGERAFHGKILNFDALPEGIAPFRAGGPPIWLGGATPAALARTGRHYDGWLPYPPDPEDYRTGLAAVRQAATEAGRTSEAVTSALFATVLVTDAADGGRGALAEYSRVNYGMPLETLETIQTLIAGTPDHVAAALGRYRAAGARHVVCRIAGLDLATQRDQVERLAELLEPAPTGGAGAPQPAGALG